MSPGGSEGAEAGRTGSCHIHSLTLQLPLRKVLDLLEMPLFYGLIAAKTAPSLQSKTPFLLQPEHRANAGVQENANADTSLPALLLPQTQENSSKGTQRTLHGSGQEK